jgi:hypothetical protein
MGVVKVETQLGMKLEVTIISNLTLYKFYAGGKYDGSA